MAGQAAKAGTAAQAAQAGIAAQAGTAAQAAQGASSMMSGAEAVMKSLLAQGADCVFGYPGGQALDLFDALSRTPGIRFVLVRHEQAAVHAADGYARSTGKCGVALVTSGPGATNTVTGIATAYMDSVPIVVISGQVDSRQIGTDAFQEADITGITLPIVKHSYLVTDARELPRTVAEAFYIATTGRPGPVLIDIPCDIAATSIEYASPGEISLMSYRPTVKGNRKQVRQAAALIASAQRPVFYAGGGVISSGASEELLKLSEDMQIPVAATLMGKGCYPASHPLYLGMMGMHGQVFVNEALAESDLVIAAGVRFTDRVTGKFGHFAPDAKVIHIDIDPAEIGKNHMTNVPIVGDAKQVLGALSEEVAKLQARPQTGAWLERIHALEEEYPLFDHVRDDAISAEAFIGRLDHALAGRDAYVTTEVGQHQMWAAQRISTELPRHFITSGGLGTMGFGLPAAIGTQLAHPASTVVCIAGDGSLQMNIQELATARACGLPIKVFVIDNRSLGMVYQYQELFGYDVEFATSLDFGAPLPDFVKLAEAYGWTGMRLTAPSGIDEAIEQALSQEGPVLCDVVVSADELALPMALSREIISDLAPGVEPYPASAITATPGEKRAWARALLEAKRAQAGALPDARRAHAGSTLDAGCALDPGAMQGEHIEKDGR